MKAKPQQKLFNAKSAMHFGQMRAEKRDDLLHQARSLSTNAPLEAIGLLRSALKNTSPYNRKIRLQIRKKMRLLKGKNGAKNASARMTLP